MQDFATLYERLDATTKTNAKVAAMAEYFATAAPADAAWAVFLLSGRRFKRLIPPSQLRAWAIEASALPEWLFADAYAAVGDLAETVALLLDQRAEADPAWIAMPLHVWIEQHLLPLRALDEDARRQRVLAWWRRLPRLQLFLLAKMLTGALRVGVSQTLTVRALARASGLEPAILHHRLMGHWQPSADFYRDLFDPEVTDEDTSRPYPFYLASPLDDEPSALGPIDAWLVEWKWDGIRGQLIRRAGATYLWSRGEELVTDRFPEIRDAAAALGDGTVLDGEILAWRDAAPLPFSVLQRRIGLQKPGKKRLADAPVTFLAYDLLEADGEDLRSRSQDARRDRLVEIVGETFPISPPVDAASWSELAAERDTARERGVEGLMLKRRTAPYRTGRKKGDWWKWKLDPLTLDAVLIYAQAGHGRRATLLTDYTFAVWKGDELVPIAKAYSGLDDQEIRQLDRWLRRHTRERFGPVRSVEPEQVFEIAFEGIQRSTRHKSGVAVRFPRIHRWRRDLAPRDADTLATIETLLPAEA